LSDGEGFVCERKNLLVYALPNFKPVYRFESTVNMGGLTKELVPDGLAICVPLTIVSSLLCILSLRCCVWLSVPVQSTAPGKTRRQNDQSDVELDHRGSTARK